MLVGVLTALGVLGAIGLLVVLFLHRAYLVVGTAIFGIATIALLPMGIYQALSIAIVPPNQFTFRPGAGDALSGGLAALPLWLSYLWLVQRALRTAPPTSPTVA